MARPRTPSSVLELRGAFKKNPQRERHDVEGNEPFNALPPPHLPVEAAPAWAYIVKRLPSVAVYDADEVAAEMASLLLWKIWTDGVDTKLMSELRQLLVQLGMTPAARAKIPARDPAKKKGEFDDL